MIHVIMVIHPVNTGISFAPKLILTHLQAVKHGSIFYTVFQEKNLPCGLGM